MTNKRPAIQPVHLALTGLAVLVLGILIPSFFVSPLSTIGFSVILGSVILLSAYAFFAVNLIRSKGKKTIKWLTLPIILALLASGGVFANYKYQQYINDKIYTNEEAITFSDFTLNITSVDFEDIALPVDAMAVKEFGDIEIDENCDSQSKDGGWKYTGFGIAVGKDGWSQNAPSDYDACVKRNYSRSALRSYREDSDRLNISYKLSAKDEVSTQDFKIQIMPDSGRNPYLKVDSLRNNQFFKGSTNRKTEDTHNGVTRSAYNYWNHHEDKTSYTPHSSSSLGGNLNKGLNREAYLGVDVRKSEKNIDLKITYKDETRTVRISR